MFLENSMFSQHIPNISSSFSSGNVYLAMVKPCKWKRTSSLLTQCSGKKPMDWGGIVVRMIETVATNENLVHNEILSKIGYQSVF